MATFFSFGGGVQSCAIAALLIHEPEKLPQPLPDLILFADTGAEPPKIYQIVDKVFGLLRAAGFSCEIVYAKDKDGNKISILDLPNANRSKGLTTPPWFTEGDNGIAMTRRHCTEDYKIRPLQQRMREFLGYQKGQRVKGRHNVWLGISVDEIKRAKMSQNNWTNHVFPLIHLNMDRTQAFSYAIKKLEIIPEKSACIMCPFTHDKEWLRRKQYEPELFEEAVKIDNTLRSIPPEQFGLKSSPYILRNCKPLETITSQPALFDTAPGIHSQKICEESHCWT